MSDLRDRVMAVLIANDDEYDEEGDGWLWHRNPDEAHLRTLALADELTRVLLDLIESQQARITRLERILCTYAVMTRTEGLGLSESDAALLASLAASPDTRP